MGRFRLLRWKMDLSSHNARDALLQLVDDWTSSLDGDITIEYVQNVCLDFSKAFDRQKHSTLYEKMRRYGFNGNIIAMVNSFFSDCLQCMKHNGCFSNYVCIPVGAPQETKLGPHIVANLFQRY